MVRKAGGETIHAMAVDISSSGMRLKLEEHIPLTVGDEVTVDVELPDHPGKPFSAWGLGNVTYVSSIAVGIQLFGGEFDRLPSREPER